MPVFLQLFGEGDKFTSAVQSHGLCIIQSRLLKFQNFDFYKQATYFSFYLIHIFCALVFCCCKTGLCCLFLRYRL